MDGKRKKRGLEVRGRLESPAGGGGTPSAGGGAGPGPPGERSNYELVCIYIY